MVTDPQRTANVEQPGPWTAVFLGLVPGLMHFMLGQRVRAAVALGVCSAVFFAGYALVCDRIFYYALGAPEGGEGWVAGLLQNLARFGLPTTLPELLNLPATMLGSILAFDGSYEGMRLWRLPRAGEHIGSWLTGAAGMLSALWAADGVWRHRLAAKGTAPAGPVAPALAAGLSWLLPGLGHARSGQRDKGLLMGACVILLWTFGLLMAQGHAVDRGIQPIWWIGQNLFGGGTLVAAFTTAPLQFQSQPAFHDLGVVLCTVAGFMNLVVMVDAYTIAERPTFPAQAAAQVEGGAR